MKSLDISSVFCSRCHISRATCLPAFVRATEVLLSNTSYDFIVVGSGAGGGPVAANLAKAGYTVLVLEAGQDCANYNYRVPCFHPLASEDPEMSWDFFVRHYADKAAQRKDSKFVADKGGVLYPRAGTLGGCTAHNAMITVYPHNSDWDGIRDLTGDDSWAPDAMRTYFERLEDCGYVTGFRRFAEGIMGLLRGQGKNPARHGYGGWLHTQTANVQIVLKDKQLLTLVIDAAVEGLAHHLGDLKLGVDSVFDPNDWRSVVSKGREGIALTPLATRGGCRNGTREHLLATAKETQGRLTIQTGALVTRVLFDDGKRAIGVEYMQGDKLYRASRTPADGATPQKQEVICNHEVILSGGAFNSPQLLMLSGIGDSTKLREFDIASVAHSPGVGMNLQDRYEVGVVSKLDRPFSVLQSAQFAGPPWKADPDPVFAEWEKGKGVYTTNGAAIAVTKRSAPDKVDPDLFIFGLPSFFKGYYPGYSEALGHYQDVFTWAVLKAHTRNTAGEVSLRSDDPRDVPNIDFHYFHEGNDTQGDDLRSVVEGVKFAREINALAAKKIGMEEMLPGPALSSDADLAAFIRNEAWGHHASCTNKIGSDGDPMAVLDSNFRVRGVSGLRVVDASVFPKIPGFFIVSAVYMIAEKASDAILNDMKIRQAAGETR